MLMVRRPMARMARVAVGTAVVAGTAGAVRHHQDQKYAAQANAQASAQDQQQAVQDMQYQQQQLALQQQQLAQQQAMLAQQAAAQAQAPALPPAPAGSITDQKISELQKLAELQKQGILTAEEFAAQKAKILNS